MGLLGLIGGKMIRIVTDSTCDLPNELIKELGVTVVPLYINIGERGYLDGEEISRAEFYQNLPNYDSHPSTGTPSPERFLAVYQALLDEGASKVISIHISEELSATVNVARRIAGEFEAGRIIVRDSDQLSYGTGFQVEMAAKMAGDSKPVEEILRVLESMAKRTLVAASLDTLEYLRRSGRMNRLMKGIGSLIQLKPILTMKDGNPGSELARTKKRALNRLVKMIQDSQPLEKLVLLHTHAAKEALVLGNKIREVIPVGDLTSVDITPVIGAHLGPNAVGFSLLSKAIN